MRTFRLSMFFASFVILVLSPLIVAFGDALHINITIRAYSLLAFIPAGFIFFFSVFSGLTPDECDTIDNMIRIGYTKQDLLERGYSESELRDYEFKRNRSIPTTSPEEEGKKS